MKIPVTFKNKKYPEFIRNNSHIKNCEIIKSFKDFEISDYRETCTHKCNISMETYVKNLKSALVKYTSNWEGWSLLLSSTITLMRSSLANLASKITVSSIKKNGMLVLPCEVKVNNYYRGKLITYQKGDSLLDLLNRLYQDLEEFGCIYTAKLSLYKKLLVDGANLELSWNDDLEVVFSTHPWDIATMSMRGIKSCQSWGKTQSTCLIGSIIDPNMGVMYITDGKPYAKYGERMLARAVVRLTAPMHRFKDTQYVEATEEDKKKRAFVIEGPYAYFSSGSANIDVYTNIFYKSMSPKLISKKLLQASKIKQYFRGIPLTPQVKKLPEKYRSYRDSGMPYVSI
jgi:hypothetical protein